MGWLTSNLGRALRQLREDRRLTQQELADRMREAGGPAATHLSRYEQGKVLPQLKTLETLLDSLDCPPEEFFALLMELAYGEEAEAREAALQEALPPQLREPANPLTLVFFLGQGSPSRPGAGRALDLAARALQAARKELDDPPEGNEDSEKDENSVE